MATSPFAVAESVPTPRKFDHIREITLTVGNFDEILVANECYGVEIRLKPGELSEELHIKHQSASDTFFEILGSAEMMLKGFSSAPSRSAADSYTQFQPGDVIGYIRPQTTAIVIYIKELTA